jgi:hypothetical protein
MITKNQAGVGEAALIIVGCLNDLAILKARNPQLLRMQNRLNSRLNRVANQLVNKVMDPETHTYRDVDDTVKALYEKHLGQVAQAGAQSIINHPEIDLTSSSFNWNRLESIMENRSFQASETTLNRLHGDVLTRIEEGIREGRSLDKHDQELKREFTDMTNNELRRISKTETHSVYQQSKYEAIMQGNAPYKRWVHGNVPIGPPREWHEAMDGEVVPVDEPFSNGLMYPGDPSGDAEEVINCGCDMVPDWGLGFNKSDEGTQDNEGESL